MIAHSKQVDDAIVLTNREDGEEEAALTSGLFISKLYISRFSPQRYVTMISSREKATVIVIADPIMMPQMFIATTLILSNKLARTYLVQQPWP